MAAPDGHPQLVAHLDNRSDSGSPDDPRWEQLAAAIKEGTPHILGEQLPEWTPEDEDPPPAELVVVADTLRRVLVDRDLASRADPRGLTVRGAVIVGEIDLADSSVGYPLCLLGCRFTDSITLVQGTLKTLDLTGSHVAGPISLLGAHISGQLNLSGASINGANKEGYSLIADRLQAGSSVFLDAEFTAACAIRLNGAHIGGQLSLRSAKINGANKDGYSLVADNLQVASGVFLDAEFTVTGAIRLHSAHIGGPLNLGGATINGADTKGRSLLADSLQAASDVFLDKGFTAARTITLSGADIGILRVGKEVGALPRLGVVTGWRIRDLRGVIRTDRRAAAGWLDTQEAAQPWQELAEVYDRNGQPADARWMRYRSAVRSTRSTTGAAWLGRQTYRWTTGHGYYPLAAAGWLAVVFVLAWSLTAAWADEFTTTTTATISADLTARAEAVATSGQAEAPPIPDLLPGRVPGAWCSDGWDVPCLSPPVYALTTAFPAAAATHAWTPPDGWSTVVFYVLRLLAWVFTALLLAGVTGLLRKQT